MLKHLPTHRSIYDEFKAAKNRKRQGAPQIEEEKKPQIKQAKLSDFKPIEKWPTNHPKSLDVDDKLLRYICLAAKPLRLTEENGFKEFVGALNPRFKCFLIIKYGP